MGPAFAVMGGVFNEQSPQRGFSLLELLMVIAVLTTMMGLGIGVTMNAVTAAKADNSMGALMNVLEVARNQATSQRRDFQMVFTTPNKIEVFRIEVPSNSTTLVQTAYLDMGQTFYRFGSLPDTPDQFGYTGALAFGSTPTIRFTSDGSLIDSSGDVLNGTIFTAIDQNVSTARAATVFGATGLIRSWQWNGTAWVN
jgi:prepilin-type N-terminal cleavage/methylation domain-containing protein